MKNLDLTPSISMKNFDLTPSQSIFRRAHYLANQMIFSANHERDKSKGDPKVGGHSSGSTSALHIMGALHLYVKSGFDHIANKPHASPTDHSFNYLLDLFLKEDLSKFSLEECNQAMKSLRAFSKDGEPVFQSYHSIFDPDHHNFLPSGTVGIPPVNAGYLALAYRFARKNGFKGVPDAHFWCLMGDAEFREGSLFEAVPDFAERELGNLTWIVDYNRQSLDGHRMINQKTLGFTDATRIAKTMQANGWEVLHLQHGSLREELFKLPHGDTYKKTLETEMDDYTLQSLLLMQNPKELVEALAKEFPHLRAFLSNLSKVDAEVDAKVDAKVDTKVGAKVDTKVDTKVGAKVDAKVDAVGAKVGAKKVWQSLRDFGGHDVKKICEALLKTKESKDRPSIIVAHTLKGWGLEMAAQSGNHSALPSKDEMLKLREQTGLKEDYGRFSKTSSEGKFLKKRSDQLYKEIIEQNHIKSKNLNKFTKEIGQKIPETLGINLKMASYPHTQWMLGQLTSKLTRLANTDNTADTDNTANTDIKNLRDDSKKLWKDDSEKLWKEASEMMVYMAPDVGTSTNLNPSMDGKIYQSNKHDDKETNYGVKDIKTPDLIPGEDKSDRFLRFEIVEANTMSCMGSFGRLRDTLGIPVMPLMTVYDFFLKRAHDQYFYNLYWRSSFIAVGTPSGVTLSPEGAQHGWKSDFQIPNQITWEPFFCQELDWIFCDSLKKHFLNDNSERNGTLIRTVTRGTEQKDFLKYLKKQKRFKSSFDGVGGAGGVDGVDGVWCE